MRGPLRIWRREWDCWVHPCTQPLRASRYGAGLRPSKFAPANLSNPGGFSPSLSARYAKAPMRGPLRIWRREWERIHFLPRQTLRALGLPESLTSGVDQLAGNLPRPCPTAISTAPRSTARRQVRWPTWSETSPDSGALGAMPSSDPPRCQARSDYVVQASCRRLCPVEPTLGSLTLSLSQQRAPVTSGARWWI